MTPPQFFVRPDAIEGDRVRFDPREAHHLARVRRLRPGDLIEATDGEGVRYRVRLDAVGAREARGTLVDRLAGAGESPLAVTLAPALLKGDRMAWLVQKATELGVARIWPVLASRGVARPGGAADPAARWTRVAREATKQCGRAVAPVVVPARAFAEIIGETARHDVTWLCQEGPGVPAPAPARSRSGEPAPRSLLLLVGPEGGFTPEEADRARAAGARPVGLGPRILRAESAALVAVVLAQYLLGDLGRDHAGE